MHIPHDNYPPADEDGKWNYEFEIPIRKLKKFGSENLQLDKLSLLIHGVLESIEFPDTVKNMDHTLLYLLMLVKL